MNLNLVKSAKYQHNTNQQNTNTIQMTKTVNRFVNLLGTSAGTNKTRKKRNLRISSFALCSDGMVVLTTQCYSLCRVQHHDTWLVAWMVKLTWPWMNIFSCIISLIEFFISYQYFWFYCMRSLSRRKSENFFIVLVTVGYVLHTLSYDLILYSLFGDHYSQT